MTFIFTFTPFYIQILLLLHYYLENHSYNIMSPHDAGGRSTYNISPIYHFYEVRILCVYMTSYMKSKNIIWVGIWKNNNNNNNVKRRNKSNGCLWPSEFSENDKVMRYVTKFWQYTACILRCLSIHLFIILDNVNDGSEKIGVSLE